VLKKLETEKDKEIVSVLQRRKIYGKLISPSNDVISICEIAEKVFRLQSCFHVKHVLEKLIIYTMSSLPMHSLFVKYEHAYDQAPLSDHKNQLIKLILSKFFQIRLHHQACTMQKFKERVRTRNNKMTLFYNQ